MKYEINVHTTSLMSHKEYKPLLLDLSRKCEQTKPFWVQKQFVYYSLIKMQKSKTDDDSRKRTNKQTTLEQNMAVMQAENSFWFNYNVLYKYVCRKQVLH
jgi:hypothetical protein